MALNAGPAKQMNGPTSGRLRNTATEVAGKNKGGIPGVPGKVGVPKVPGFGADYGSVPGATGQLAGAYAAFQNVVASMRAQRVGLKAGFQTDKAAIRAEGIGAMSEVINTGIDRGLTGASSVSQEAIGVVAGVKTGIEAARGEMKQGMLASKVEEQNAYLNYQVTQEQMAMQAEAARQANAIAEAQMAASAAASENMMAGLEALLGGGKEVPAAKTISGVVVEPVPGGGYQVPGIGFIPKDTPLPVLKRMIREQKAKTTGFISDRIASGRM